MYLFSGKGRKPEIGALPVYLRSRTRVPYVHLPVKSKSVVLHSTTIHITHLSPGRKATSPDMSLNTPSEEQRIRNYQL
jgi:hypothetical protein